MVGSQTLLEVTMKSEDRVEASMGARLNQAADHVDQLQANIAKIRNFLKEPCAELAYTIKEAREALNSLNQEFHEFNAYWNVKFTK